MTTAPAPVPGPSVREAAAMVGGLFERRGRMVYGICRAMLRDPHEAEDATQQVFLAAHKALLSGTAVRDSGSWLASIARNECRARIVAGMRRPLPVADEDLDALPAGGDDVRRRAQLDELKSALAELPERQREAVVLRYLYGLRYGEVATALGLSRPATEALLFRARRALRVRLRPVVGAALVVPSVVREELALALPGFGGGSAAGTAAVGVTGGILAKLTAGSAGVKVATAAVAVSTVGAVGAVPSERADRSAVPPAIAESSTRAGAELATESVVADRDEEKRHDDSSHSGPSTHSGTSDDEAEDRSGSNGRDGEAETSGSESGSNGGRADGGEAQGAEADSSSGSTSGPSAGSSSGPSGSAEPAETDVVDTVSSEGSGSGGGRESGDHVDGGSGGSGSGSSGGAERSDED